MLHSCGSRHPLSNADYRRLIAFCFKPNFSVCLLDFLECCAQPSSSSEDGRPVVCCFDKSRLRLLVSTDTLPTWCLCISCTYNRLSEVNLPGPRVCSCVCACELGCNQIIEGEILINMCWFCKRKCNFNYWLTVLAPFPLSSVLLLLMLNKKKGGINRRTAQRCLVGERLVNCTHQLYLGAGSNEITSHFV